MIIRGHQRTKASAARIAGTLIWTNFDRHALLDLVSKLAGTFIANADDIRPQFRTDENAFLSQNAIFYSPLVRDNGVPVDATIDSLSGVRLDDVSGFKEVAKPWYSDQLLRNRPWMVGSDRFRPGVSSRGRKISLARARAGRIALAGRGRRGRGPPGAAAVAGADHRQGHRVRFSRSAQGPGHSEFRRRRGRGRQRNRHRQRRAQLPTRSGTSERRFCRQPGNSCRGRQDAPDSR